MSEAAPHPLDVFCDNLTLRARHGHLSRHAEHAAEIARVFEILARRYEPAGPPQRQKKCNPVFLDADGSKRWAALEGAVVALVQEDAPAVLQGRVVLSLNYEELMAHVDPQAIVQQGKEISARYPQVYRGEDLKRFPDLQRTFQQHMRETEDWQQSNAAYQRLRAVLTALQAREEPTVLFIDHLHRILGGDWQHYPFDMFSLLKPFLHRWQIQLWGACTLAEYQIIERDGSMQRCFHEVCLPSVRTLLK